MGIENSFNNTPQEAPKPEGQERSSVTPEKKNYDDGKNTLLLGVGKDTIDLSGIQELADKNGFAQRGEFHITVLGFKNGAEVKKALKALPEAERESALAQIKTLVEETDFSFTLEPQRYHIAKEYVSPDPKNKGAELKERRESYIQMVSLPGMKIFYDKLNAILDTNLEAPPAHTTLYTGGDDKEKSKMGIGINTQDEFLKMNPELIS